MGLFGELDLENVSEDAFGVPNGTYPAIITEAKTVESETKVDEHGNPIAGLVITFQVNDPDSEFDEREVGHFQSIPRPVGDKKTSKESRNASYLKKLLSSLGVPPSKMNDVETDDLVGLDVYITTKKNGEYTNVREVKLQSEVETSLSSFS